MRTLAILIALGFAVIPDRPEDVRPKDTWVGKVVFVRYHVSNFDTAGEPRGLRMDSDEGISLTSNQYVAYAERPEYIQIKTREGVLGWVRKVDMVPLEDAVAFFTKQIDADRTDVSAYHRRASAWRFKGEYDAALKDMNTAMSMSPDGSVFNNRGLVWHAKGDFDKAIADFSTIIDRDPGYPLHHVNRANSRLGKGDYHRAIEDATIAINLNPRHPEAHRLRGLGYMGKKDLDKAISDFSRAIELDAKLAHAYADRANALAVKKQHAQARADFEQALKLEPWNAMTTASAALWLATCGDEKHRDGKRALGLAQRAQSLERNNSLALQALAAAHAELGQFPDAVRWQEHALQDPQLKGDTVARARLDAYRNKKPWRQD